MPTKTAYSAKLFVSLLLLAYFGATSSCVRGSKGHRISSSRYEGSSYPPLIFEDEEDYSFAKKTESGSRAEGFSNGLIVMSSGSADDVVRASAFSPNQNRLYLAGRSYAASEGDNVLLGSFLPDGIADPSFGTAGFASYNNGSNGGDQAHAISVQSDGKILIGGKSWLSNTHDFLVVRFLSTGALDTTFGSSGVKAQTIGSSTDIVRSLIWQTDGSILTAGASDDSGEYRFAAAKLTNAGAMDTSFGTGGAVTVDVVAGRDDYATGATIVSGRLAVVGGTYNASNNWDITLVSFQTDGSADTAFSVDGKHSTTIGSGDDILWAATTDSSNRIVGVGQTRTSKDDFLIVRYLTDGSLDSTFSSDGVLTQSIRSSTDVARAVAMNDTSIFISGESAKDGHIHFGAMKVLSGGSLDTTFSSDGVVSQSIQGTYDISQSVVTTNDGLLYFTGKTWANGYWDLAVARYKPNGTLAAAGDQDTAYGTSGYAEANVSGAAFQQETLYGLAAQSDGKVISAGGFRISTRANRDLQYGMAISRHTKTGALDTTFSSDGIITSTTDGLVKSWNTVAVQPDGKILLAGQDSILALGRLNTDGSFDTTFGTNGTRRLNSNNSNAAGNSIVLHPNGKFNVVGSDTNAGTGKPQFMVGKFLTDGSTDTVFGTSGFVSNSFGNHHAVPRAGLLQTDEKIVAVGYSTLDLSNYDVLLMRYLTDGSLDTTFDSDGVNGHTIGSSHEAYYAAAIQTDQKVVATGASFTGSRRDFVVGRYLTTGQLDTAFGNNGATVHSVGADNNNSFEVFVHSDGKILSLGSYDAGGVFDYGIARYTNSGALDTTYAMAGINRIDSPLQLNGIDAAAITPDGRIVAGGGGFSWRLLRIWP